VDRRGGQKGDDLTSTSGAINFTVLVEIKTPATPLLPRNWRNQEWSVEPIETTNRRVITDPDEYVYMG
jgi:hypothetical protein